MITEQVSSFGSILGFTGWTTTLHEATRTDEAQDEQQKNVKAAFEPYYGSRFKPFCDWQVASLTRAALSTGGRALMRLTSIDLILRQSGNSGFGSRPHKPSRSYHPRLPCF